MINNIFQTGVIINIFWDFKISYNVRKEATQSLRYITIFRTDFTFFYKCDLFVKLFCIEENAFSFLKMPCYCLCFSSRLGEILFWFLATETMILLWHIPFPVFFRRIFWKLISKFSMFHVHGVLFSISLELISRMQIYSTCKKIFEYFHDFERTLKSVGTWNQKSICGMYSRVD